MEKEGFKKVGYVLYIKNFQSVQDDVFEVKGELYYCTNYVHSAHQIKKIELKPIRNLKSGDFYEEREALN